jgi:hypothetical protein
MAVTFVSGLGRDGLHKAPLLRGPREWNEHCYGCMQAMKAAMHDTSRSDAIMITSETWLAYSHFVLSSRAPRSDSLDVFFTPTRSMRDRW